MHTEPSPLSPALLTLWASNHLLLRRVKKTKGGLSGWVLDEQMNALNAWRRTLKKKELGGTKGFVLWQLWLDNWFTNKLVNNNVPLANWE
jgi:hypothetical protein